MHFPNLSVLPLTILLTLPLTSAWTFSGYRFPGLKDRIFHHTGSDYDTSHCIDIPDHAIRSFTWLPRIGIECAFELHDKHGCAGEVLASGDVGENVKVMPKDKQARASSLRVHCMPF